MNRIIYIIVISLIAHQCPLFASYSWDGGKDPEKWSVTHPMFSPKGTRFCFSLVTAPGGRQHLISANTDGSDIRLWNSSCPIDTGSDKPLHFLWWDEDHICGNDQETEGDTPHDLTVKLWDRDGNYIKTIAGFGYHLGLSPDRNWLSAETFYHDDPIDLFLYRTGSIEPAAYAFRHYGTKITWKLYSHVNPSFGRNSKRLYYNRPVDNEYLQAYFADISELE